jgi:hypothetical protein
MLQYVTICYNMLQYVTICYNMLQYVTIGYNMLQYVTICYNMLQYVTIAPVNTLEIKFARSIFFPVTSTDALSICLHEEFSSHVNSTNRMANGGEYRELRWRGKCNR